MNGQLALPPPRFTLIRDKYKAPRTRAELLARSEDVMKARHYQLHHVLLSERTPDTYEDLMACHHELGHQAIIFLITDRENAKTVRFRRKWRSAA